MKFLSSIEGIILAPTAVPTARTEISKKFLFFFLRQFAQKKLNEMKLFGTGQCFKIYLYFVQNHFFILSGKGNCRETPAKGIPKQGAWKCRGFVYKTVTKIH